MQVKSFVPFVNRYVFQNYLVSLLIIVLLYLGLIPMLKSFALQLIFKFFAIVLGVIAVVSVRKSRNYILAISIFGFIEVMINWISIYYENKYMVLAGNTAAITFFSLLAISIINFIFREEKITWNIICGSIVIYFILGMMWAEIFTVVEILQPGSFSLDQDHAITRIMNQDRVLDSALYFTYFSYSTLTTLGYGDITPMTEHARYLSFLEAIMGQLYMIVLVARLVGLQISQSQNRTE